MRVVPRLAVLLAPAALVRAYVCNYRGTGSTSVYPTYVTLPDFCTPNPNEPYCNEQYVRYPAFCLPAGVAAGCPEGPDCWCAERC